MRYLVLTTRPEDNRYGDTPTSYSFPKRYLSFFTPLETGEEVMAVLYEPRRGQGRQSYVAWTTLRQPAQPEPHDPSLWKIQYAEEVRPFPRLVPKALDGHDFEELLRLTPLGRHGPTLQGRSVRSISAADFLAILTYAEVVPAVLQDEPGAVERERQEWLVRRLARDGSFRERVLRAYGYRCAITGIGYHQFQQFGAGKLVDGAHLRPVAAQGSDDLRNGLALTPSLHGLFDAGLFTLEYAGEEIRVKPSSDLQHCDLSPTGSASQLILTGPLRLPADSHHWPAHEALAYHQQHIFRP